jgi:hypothetical protein
MALRTTRDGDVNGMAGAACLRAGGLRQTGMFVCLAGKLEACAKQRACNTAEIATAYSARG